MLKISPALIFAALVCFATIPGSFQQTEAKDCKGVLDVIAVVDGSGSVSDADFNKTLQALVKLTQALDVKTPDRRLGIVVFSRNVSRVINLTGDVTSLTDSIDSIKKPGGGTLTHLGIARMIRMFAEFKRKGVPQVGIVITDGKSHSKNRTLGEASGASDAGINMFSIGIGKNLNARELEGIASAPDQALNLTDFNELANAIVNLINDVCNETQAPGPTFETQTPGPCDGCRYVNGIGYNTHAQCDKFIQCHATHTGSYDFAIQTCQYGTFWNQDSLLCDFLYNVDCPNDPCLDNVTTSYKTSGNCLQYYTCVNQRSKTASCPDGRSYQAGVCVEDPKCIASTGRSTDVCKYTAVPGDVCRYNWEVNGDNHTFVCAPGTTFKSSSCSCLIDSSSKCGNTCRPLVDIDFNDDEGEYANHGAVISNGYAYFDGNSHIKILSLANVDFNSRLNIRLRLKNDNSTGNIRQVVLNNNDCKAITTVSITTEGLQTSFLAVNTTGFQQSVTTKTQSANSNEWKVVEYDLKLGVLTGTVNGEASSAPIAGPIKRTQCAFQLGRGDGLSGFKGYIDYIIVTRC